MAFTDPSHGKQVSPSSVLSSLPVTNRSGPPVLATLAENSRHNCGWRGRGEGEQGYNEFDFF
jgi:hypothetical protein